MITRVNAVHQIGCCIGNVGEGVYAEICSNEAESNYSQFVMKGWHSSNAGLMCDSSMCYWLAVLIACLYCSNGEFEDGGERGTREQRERSWKFAKSRRARPAGGGEEHLQVHKARQCDVVDVVSRFVNKSAAAAVLSSCVFQAVLPGRFSPKVQPTSTHLTRLQCPGEVSAMQCIGSRNPVTN